MYTLRIFLAGLILTLVVATLTSCMTVSKAYPGADRPAQDLATIKGFGTECYGSVEIANLDGQYSGDELAVLPGSHSMTLDYMSKPFIPEDSDTSFFAECVIAVRYNVTFTVQAGYTYWFNASEDAPGPRVIGVWNAPAGNFPSGTQMQAQLTEINRRRACFIDGRFRQCFP